MQHSMQHADKSWRSTSTYFWEEENNNTNNNNNNNNNNKRSAAGVSESDLAKIFLLPFKATERKPQKEIKLTMFQFKIIHRILQTNSLLHKMKKFPRPPVPFVLQSLRSCGIN